ncbi:Replication protein A 70 kDa DNA-binding subunit B [Bienertia sinuspersici]
MEMAVKDVSDINPSKESWKLVVRVTHLWHVPSYNNPSELHSIGLVLMDEKGDKIQASIKISIKMTY